MQVVSNCKIVEWDVFSIAFAREWCGIRIHLVVHILLDDIETLLDIDSNPRLFDSPVFQSLLLDIPVAFSQSW